MDNMLLDVEAARAAAASAGKVGVVGYCLGGSLSWLAATRLHGFAAASCYYGGRIAANSGEKPHCAVQMHFGENDQSISAADIEKIRANKDANYGFNAATGGYEDLVKAGVIDPTKVTRSALQNAASISALMLTTEAMICEIPEKKSAPPMGPEHGGGGGMDF